MEGHNYQSAAVELGVIFSTINFHMQNIYGKLRIEQHLPNPNEPTAPQRRPIVVLEALSYDERDSMSQL